MFSKNVQKCHRHSILYLTRLCCAYSLSCVWPFATPWTVALSMGILQAKILEWVVIPFSRASSQPGELPDPGLPHCRWILYGLSQWLGVSNADALHIFVNSSYHELSWCCLSTSGSRVISILNSNQIREPIPKTHNQFRKPILQTVSLPPLAVPTSVLVRVLQRNRPSRGRVCVCVRACVCVCACVCACVCV